MVAGGGRGVPEIQLMYNKHSHGKFKKKNKKKRKNLVRRFQRESSRNNILPTEGMKVGFLLPPLCFSFQTVQGTPEALFQPFLLRPEMPETHEFSKPTKGGRGGGAGKGLITKSAAFITFFSLHQRHLCF